MTELHQAAASGDADLVEEILRQNKYDPNQRDVDWNNKTPLHWAAARGQAEIVRVLIEHGARPCLCTGSGWTAAHFAAEAGRLQVLRMLHAFHAPLDKEDCCGDKPVQIAEVYGHIDCVQFLKRAETEHQEYRRSALLSGLSLDDRDEEWEEQKRDTTHQRTAQNVKAHAPEIKSTCKTWACSKKNE
ncbi:ankyrin repeat domain-containing protein 66 [Clupea harengus]|uniref:Ankyrin repeat domain-containing protein 66 n=1 Tax=Clupea harengus TaxID=7950 RepID=A0A6P3VQT4_CLUHA|nr:ankyrin repeat domain-containing protein 66 [Clupea harengus]